MRIFSYLLLVLLIASVISRIYYYPYIENLPTPKQEDVFWNSLFFGIGYLLNAWFVIKMASPTMYSINKYTKADIDSEVNHAGTILFVMLALAGIGSILKAFFSYIVIFVDAESYISFFHNLIVVYLFFLYYIISLILSHEKNNNNR